MERSGRGDEGREKSLSVGRHRRGDARGRHPSFLKGVGEALLPVSAHTGGNPRTSPGSSVIIVAFLLEGAAWYAALQNARRVVEFSGGRSGCETPSFSSIQPLWLSFSFLSFVFSFGLDFFDAPANVSCGYYINIVGRKPILMRCFLAYELSQG
jgi:hypothetical protein